MVRPASSTTSRKSGEAGEAVDKGDCARNGAAADNTPAIATQTADRKRGLATSLKNSPNSAISLAQQKSPARQPGACGSALSREERRPLRHGRVAWLTAFQPITVAGPRPIRTAFPATHACKLKFECMPRPAPMSTTSAKLVNPFPPDP